MPSDCCYFVDKAAAAAAAPALKYFALFYTARQCLHKIWDRPAEFVEFGLQLGCYVVYHLNPHNLINF